MLSDILPTGYEVGVLNGRVRPGDVVAVVGAGPVGLAVIRELTGGLGAHVAIEAVGMPAAFELAATLVRPCGHVAITTGLVDAYSTATLLELLAAHQIDAGRFITHHFAFDEFDAAYDMFGRATDTGALKVVLTRKP
jgi:alcohol dehydrogenase